MRKELLLLSLSLCALPAFAADPQPINTGQNLPSWPKTMETWRKYFPGLEEEVKKAFEEAKKDGIFKLETNLSPVAWNITAEKGVIINSINSGFYRSYRDPKTHEIVFPELENANNDVLIKTQGDIIVSPKSTNHAGYGYAVAVDSDTSTTLEAGKKIVLKALDQKSDSSYQDGLSIAVAENGKLNLKAEDVYVYGGVVAQYGATVNINASNSLYFLKPTDPAVGIKNANEMPISLIASGMTLSASNIFFNRQVDIGQTFFDTPHPSQLTIEDNLEENIAVENVWFYFPAFVDDYSHLKVNIAGSVVFNEELVLSNNSSSDISATKIRVKNILINGTDSKASFNVKDNGVMQVDGIIKVGNRSHVDINLGKGSSLRAYVEADPLGSTSVTMGQGSIWFPISDSNVNTLTMSKTSVLEMGAPGESITVTTDTLQGDCSVLWYQPRAQGTLKINNKSEGTHFALLGSTGRSIQETHYLFQTVVIDGSSPENSKGEFYLANGGVVEAGPYQYKLQLGEYADGSDKVWLVTAAQNPKPEAPPSDGQPPADSPSQPQDPLPPLPSEPNNPGTYPDDLMPKPDGLSSGAKLALAAIGQGTQVTQYLGALSELRERLGDIRNNFNESHDRTYVLFRYDKSRLSFHEGVSGRLKNLGTAIGINRQISPEVIVGADIDFAHAKLKVNDDEKGKVKTDAVGARGYLTWFNQKGSYADVVLTFNQYRHHLSTEMIDGVPTSAKYSNFGAGVSAEAGHQFQFLNSGEHDYYFIQPQIQLSSYWLKGKDFSLDNGMYVSVKDGKSLTGRIGVDIGKNFLIADKNPAQVYLQGGILHEFLGKTKARLNEFSFEDKSLGTRAYYGVGFEVKAKDRVKFFAQVNRESGHRIKTDLQIRVGASILF